MEREDEDTTRERRRLFRRALSSLLGSIEAAAAARACRAPECNLYQLMKDREKMSSEGEVRNWCIQVFQGLAYMHQRGYFHRDLKPGTFIIASESFVKCAI
ncbi:hypothetical protein Ahy_B05g077543 [Arachis hypogaea]|uniref:Protein kinase domain-containing protein n=1 Tax=Arachis hypogaea TaxID=3818 RepID=A0A444Z545_ARAHY|nr:hypothetical protein Ahy_B05g077543 [Arachis hypogaea]